MITSSRRLRVAAVVPVLAMLLAACGGDSGPTAGGGGDDGEGGGGSGELTVWAMGAEGENLPTLAEQYEQEHDGVTIDVVPVPWETAHDKLLTSIAGGETPDITQMGTTWMGEFAETGALAELPEGLVDEGAFYEGAWSTALFEDTAYGVPWYVDTRLMYYRTDVAEKAGWEEPPATWEELQQFAADLRDKGGARYGINLSPNNWQELMPFVWQTGAEVWDGEAFDFTSEGFKEGMAYYDSFFEDGVTAEYIPNFDVTEGFVQGTHPLFFSGPWHVGLIEDLGGDDIEGKFDVALMPENENQVSFVGGSDLVVFNDSEQQEAAWDFVAWLSEAETQQEWYRITSDLPAVKEAWSSGDLAEDERLALFGEQMEMTKAPPVIPEWEEIAAVINTELEKVTTGSESVDDAAATIQQEAESMVKG